MSRIVQFYHWLLMWFEAKAVEPPPDIVELLQPPTEVVPAGNVPRAEVEEIGVFHFKGAILDQLDTYFEVLERMKKADHEAYGIYSKIGVNLIPRYKANAIDFKNIEPWWNLNRPSLGAVAYADLSYSKFYESTRADEDKKKRWLLPRFFFFRKYTRALMPCDMERPKIAGDVYVCTIYWDDGVKHGAPWEFGVVLGNNRMLQVLKSKGEAIRVRSSMSHKKLGAARGGKRTVSLPSFGWEHHPVFRGWAEEHKRPVEDFLAEVFVEALNTYEASQLSMIRVDVAKGGLHGAFGVNILRTPYFFKDRDLVVNHNGRKKRIFHIVRGHVRFTGAMVKTHFRGLREFDWNGYRIRITVPIRDHLPTEAFTGGGIDEGALELSGKNIRTVPLTRVASVMRQVLDGKRPSLH